MLAKPWMPTGVMAASELPVSTASQRPVATSRAAAPIEWAPVAQAVTTVSHGPCHPWRMEMAAAPALGIIMGTRKGDTRRGPLVWKVMICSSSVFSPPTPVPKMTPRRRGSTSRSPAWPMASAATASANWANRSIRRISLTLSNRGSASKSSMARLASPGSTNRPSQKASTPVPQRASTPIPVMATRRPSIRAWR